MGREDETQDLASKLHHGKEESCTQNTNFWIFAAQ